MANNVYAVNRANLVDATEHLLNRDEDTRVAISSLATATERLAGVLAKQLGRDAALVLAAVDRARELCPAPTEVPEVESGEGNTGDV